MTGTEPESAPMQTSWWRELRAGLALLTGLFVYDLWTCTWAIKKALRKKDSDPEAASIMLGELASYGLLMLAAYLLMGLVAGLALGLLQRSLGPAALGRRRLRWWGLATLGVLWIFLRGSIYWPRMYIGMPAQHWMAGNVSPVMIDALMGCLLLLWLLWGLLRSGGQLKAALGASALFLVVSQVDEHPEAPPPPPSEGPNVILLGIDALRPDHLQSFGYTRDTAPQLEAFLEEARVFESSFTPLARTWPAWNSILTGTEPIVHGKRDSLPAPWDVLPRVPTLVDVVKEQGYHTQFLTDDSRFSYMVDEHGFDEVVQPPVGIRPFVISRYQPYFRIFFQFLHGPRLGWKLVPDYRYNQAFGITHEYMHFAERLAQAVHDGAESGPFFIAAHACLLHTPGDRPWPHHTEYGMASYRGGNRYKYRSLGSTLADDGDFANGERLLKLEKNRKSQQQNLNLYDSGMTMVDHTWSRLKRALDEGDLWDNTLIIVFSDHGEDFLEEETRYAYRGPNHGFHPFGVGQHQVLMALKGGGFESGRSADELVSLIDIAPTVARYLGVEMEAQGHPLQDPLPEDRLLYGETGVSEAIYWDEDHKEYPFGRSSNRYRVDPETLRLYQVPEYDAPTIEAKDRWVHDGEFWLTEEALKSGPSYKLFRWREDPRFATDLSEEHPEALERLKEELQARPRNVALEEIPDFMAAWRGQSHRAMSEEEEPSLSTESAEQQD